MFGEVVLAILNPSTRALGPIYLSQLQGAVIGAPLPLGESLILAWPQIVGLVAARSCCSSPAISSSSGRRCAPEAARASGGAVKAARPVSR